MELAPTSPQAGLAGQAQEEGAAGWTMSGATDKVIIIRSGEVYAINCVKVIFDPKALETCGMMQSWAPPAEPKNRQQRRDPNFGKAHDTYRPRR